ncbi:SWIM zinc finger family protein [Streptomyces sp. H27-D2]|uniref:SWIM zinc finger family protein n=1 Tax=Streptomyces sp. H27-D2 TaxID=3046304 RepID=UPI002DBE70AE|nr:SWF or SNF family helicase [Streptomyces sp. H27-D2]MEC4020360.1 SWF or SNF family helicase [Streptomyces sp. H27-D2]
MSDTHPDDAHADDTPPAHDDPGAAAPERTFAALPPAQGRGFAQTWWGRAWLKAMEDTALDGEQLRRGRKYAREGAVGAVSVRPGRITAVVQDRDRTAYRSDVLLQQLGEADWDRLLDMVADRSGHIAALLDREMPPILVEDAAAAGVDLLPGIGDLEPECSCESWDHCPHTSALCYQVARLLDQDPFVLLLMRGRGERELLDELQRRSAARAVGHESAPAPAQPPAGVGALEPSAARDILPPRPPAPPRVAEPGPPPVLDGGRPPAPGAAGAPGIDVAALGFLVADTAARAQRLLAEALSPWHAETAPPAALTPWQDAVRLAARAPRSPVAARLATGSGRERADLARAVRAWEHGGAAGLDVLEEDWTPGPDALARARAGLAAAWADDEERPRLRATRNRWTAVGSDAQLRYGRDGRWWPYRKERGSWWPAGPADHDPAAALAILLAEG